MLSKYCWLVKNLVQIPTKKPRQNGLVQNDLSKMAPWSSWTWTTWGTFWPIFPIIFFCFLVVSTLCFSKSLLNFIFFKCSTVGFHRCYIIYTSHRSTFKRQGFSYQIECRAFLHIEALQKKMWCILVLLSFLSLQSPSYLFLS